MFQPHYRTVLATGLLVGAIMLAPSFAALAAEPELPLQLAGEKEDGDPYAVLNKKVFAFNDGLDRSVFEPVARGYRAVLPSLASRGVSNFFANLGQPRVMLNNLLQGKFRHATEDLVRIFLNTTVGIGGLIDVASAAGIPRHDEDFGQTLGVWGVKRSNYVVLPVLGSSNTRDTIGEIVDFFTFPLLYYQDTLVRDGLYLLMFVDRRAVLLSASDVLEQAAGENRYEFVREAYKQNRRNDIYDGNPPMDLPYMQLFDELPPDVPPAPAR